MDRPVITPRRMVLVSNNYQQSPIILPKPKPRISSVTKSCLESFYNNQDFAVTPVPKPRYSLKRKQPFKEEILKAESSVGTEEPYPTQIDVLSNVGSCSRHDIFEPDNRSSFATEANAAFHKTKNGQLRTIEDDRNLSNQYLPEHYERKPKVKRRKTESPPSFFTMCCIL